MKYISFIFLSLFTFLQPVVYSQITMNAVPTTKGCAPLTVTFSQTNTLSSVTSIRWSFGDGTSSTDNAPTHTYNQGGSYTVKVFLNGTDSLIKINFVNVFKPQASIEYRDTITGSPLIIALQAMAHNENSHTTMPYTYSWEINSLAAGTERIVTHTFDSIGTYNSSVIVTDTLGCKDTATFVIQLIEKLKIPNVFSPNNDNINDLFLVSSNERYFLNFQLFTRTGQLVYKTKAKTIEWDGKMDTGEDLPTGIYFYIIDAEGSNPPLKEKGFLYIYR
jgi:gliding motility-associated-like protein